jgi:hypothetical protein
MSRVTVERLTEAFRQWDTNSTKGNWQDREDPEENAVARAEYLLELLENIS